MCYKSLIWHVVYFLIFSLSVSSGPVQNKSINHTPLNTNEEIESTTNCNEICGCDRAYIFNETTNECDINMDYVLKTVLMQMNNEKSGYKYEDHDIVNDDGMAKRLRLEAQRVFKGIIISVIIFMACASLCAVGACVYCFHINYSDRKLKRDVKALAKKLKRNYNSRRTVRRTPLEPIEESCNVVVGNAGLYVV